MFMTPIKSRPLQPFAIDERGEPTIIINPQGKGGQCSRARDRKYHGGKRQTANQNQERGGEKGGEIAFWIIQTGRKTVRRARPRKEGKVGLVTVRPGTKTPEKRGGEKLCWSRWQLDRNEASRHCIGDVREEGVVPQPYSKGR